MVQISSTQKQLSDLGLWAGVECGSYIKLRTFLTDIEELNTEQARKFKESLALVHSVFEKVVSQ